MFFNQLKLILMAVLISAPLVVANAGTNLLSITHESVKEKIKGEKGQLFTQYIYHLLNKTDQRRINISIYAKDGRKQPESCSLTIYSAKGEELSEKILKGGDCQPYYDALVAGTTSELSFVLE